MSERPAVLVARRLPQPVMDALGARCTVDLWEGDGAIPRDELLRRIAGKRGVITLLTDTVDEALLDAAGPDLMIVANYAVGFDNIDVPACTRRGVLVSNTPDVLTEATADMAWVLLMAAARRVVEGDRFLRSRTPWIWHPEMLLGWDIHHKVLGIVGFGRIGRAVARRAAGFDMQVIYHNPHRLSAAVERGLCIEYRAFDDLLTEADFVSVHAPLTSRTHHLFGAEQFQAMKRTAVLVNTARGPIVDEVALATALRAGEIFAASLDVFEREPEVHAALLELPNVTLVPHLGSATVDTRLAMGLLATENLLAALEERRPPTLINAAVWTGRGTP